MKFQDRIYLMLFSLMITINLIFRLSGVINIWISFLVMAICYTIFNNKWKIGTILYISIWNIQSAIRIVIEGQTAMKPFLNSFVRLGSKTTGFIDKLYSIQNEPLREYTILKYETLSRLVASWFVEAATVLLVTITLFFSPLIFVIFAKIFDKCFKIKKRIQLMEVKG